MECVKDVLCHFRMEKKAKGDIIFCTKEGILHREDVLL